MRAIITCGGTGGHITPALAIADIIKQYFSGAELLFVGARGGMEEELVARAGYRIRLLEVQGLSRKLTPQNLTALYQAHTAVKKAKILLREYAPDIVIGTGGYACYPALFAATQLNIPTAVHESNAVPGLAVRRLARHVDRIWLNFEKAQQALPRGARCLTVGNPLPVGYRVPAPALLSPGCRRMLLSFGGSLGARELNRAVLSMMEAEKENAEVYHLHASGKREYEQMRAAFCEKGLDVYPHLKLVPFLSDMPQQMAAASLVICRAGAMSISELAALGRPAILLPSPNVTGNHQYKNAMLLAECGAAVCLTEGEVAKGALPPVVEELLQNEEKRKALSRAIRRFHDPHSNARILRDILQLTMTDKN